MSKPLFCVILIASVPVIAANEQRASEAIILRDLPPQSVCHQSSKSLANEPTVQRTLKLTCDSSIVSCDAPGFEPIDAEAAEICKRGQLPWVGSRQVQLRTNERLDLARVEWRDLDSESNWTLQAARSMQATPLRFIESSSIPSRVISIIRPGASPVSKPVVWLRDSLSWDVPDPIAGGEVVIGIAPVPVRPVEFRIEPGGRTAKPVQGFVVLAGLLPGEYTLTPIYDGGVSARSERFEIRSQQTTPIYLQGADVGGARISRQAAACSTEETLNLFKAVAFEAPARKAIELVPVIAHSSTPNCDWTFAGLQPGTYRATVYAHGQTLETAEFDVAVQQFTNVSLAQSVVSVFGRLTLNGEPARQRTVEFFQLGNSSRISVTTDEDGRYRAFMNKPGDYLMAVRGWSQTRRIVARKDETQIDWAVTGGILTIVLNGVTDDTMIEIARKAPELLIWHQLPRAETRHSFEGIPFGTFTVVARGKGASSKPRSVTLSPNDPEQEITLNLTTNRSNVVVRGQNGAPISGARFSKLSPQPQETAPGVYSLDGVAPGTELRIKPPAPWAPVCVLAPENRDREIVLAQGAPVHLELTGFERWELGSDLGRLTGIPSSECLVAFGDFAVKQISAPNNPTIVFEILNFYWQVPGQKAYYPASGGKYAINEADSVLAVRK